MSDRVLQYEPLTKKQPDPNNPYEWKRMNDPNYSDIFEWCYKAGGTPKPGIRKKTELHASCGHWTNADIKH